MGILSPEIEKLSEKLQKDPNSKVFFNLAEEYYKAGMLDEALTVLSPGLKANPNYLSAKVLLGKIYSDQQKTKESKEVFEQILKINPDNIIANKKLSTIYFNESLYQEAENCCNQILFFNARDTEALTLLQKIKEAKQSSLKKSAGPNDVVSPLKVDEPMISAARKEPNDSSQDGKAFPNHPLAAIPSNEFVSQTPLQKSIPPPPPSVPEPVDFLSLKGENLVVSKISEAKSSNVYPPKEIEKGINFSDVMKEEEIKPPADTLNRSEASKEGKKPGSPKENQEHLDTIALAELYVKQGHYDQGIQIYQKFLDQDPYNETLRQQLEDAKTIGSLLGIKDKSKKIEEEILQTILPEDPLKQKQSVSNISKISPQEGSGGKMLNPKKEAKINRIKQWLETLKKAHL